MWTLGTENNFYKSKEWKKLIEYLKLKRVNEEGELICEHCKKPIVKKYDCTVHHVIELTEENVNDTNISLNEDNLMLVHFKCHNEIHNRFGYSRKQVYIVYGSPFSGKMDYVRSSAGQDDLICDIDSIYQCVSINNRYNKSNKLKSNVFAIKDFIIDMIKVRQGKWNNAFIVATLPSRQQRERLCNLVNARLVFINTSKEDCIRRCIEQTNNNKEYIDYIEEWFEEFQE